MTACVPKCWLDGRGFLGHTRGSSKWERVPGCRPSSRSRCLPTDQSPCEGQGEATTGPEAIKAPMAFDSNFFMSPQLAGPASGKIGCLLLPIKAHKLCPQIQLNGISVFRECVCACVSERSEGAGLRSRRWRAFANHETVLATGPKGLDASSATPSVQARVQAIRGTYWENHALTSIQIVKGVYVHLSPGE